MKKPPLTEIVIIGSELTSGDVVDINGGWLAARLSTLGTRVEKITIVGDREWAIEDAIDKALKSINIDYIIVSGGLGSTSDDVTTKAAAKVTGTRLVISDELLDHIKSTMAARGKEMHPSQERQSLIPQRAKLLKNSIGTACGYILHHKGKVLIFLPGVPGEMRKMVDEVLIPELSEELAAKAPSSKFFHTFGLPETRIEELISEPLKGFEELDISYLPSSEGVTVKILSRGDESERIIEESVRMIREKLGDNIFNEDRRDMEETVGNLLNMKKKSVSVAESCTGGAIGKKLTNVPGSSSYFSLGVVTYSNEAKTKILGVQPSIIEEHGAVSSQVAAAMAQGIRRIGRTDYGLAVTGIAGPDGGSPEKPVGTVYIAISSEEGTRFKGLRFGGDRNDIRERTSQAALDILRRELIS